MPATKPQPPVARDLAPGQRRAEIAIAALFLLTAATSIYGVTVLDPILKAPDYLARVYPAKGAIAWGAALVDQQYRRRVHRGLRLAAAAPPR